MKSQNRTDSEILSSAKQADVVTSEGTISEIKVRHTRSTHPNQCYCEICKQTRFENFSSQAELEIKEELDYFRP